MSYWRKINKVMFWLSLVFNSLVVLALAIVFFVIASDSYNGGLFVLYGFSALIGGSIFVLTSHSLWGMIIEHLDNSAAVKRKVCGDPEPAPRYAVPVQQVPMQQMPANWQCPICGGINAANTGFCYNCGKPRQ